MVAVEDLQMSMFLHESKRGQSYRPGDGAVTLARAASDLQRWSRLAEVQIDEPITESCTAYDKSHIAPVTPVP